MHAYAFRPAMIVAGLLGLVSVSTAVPASSPATADFSGAWRPDDLHSDTPDAVVGLLRTEAKRELAPLSDKAVAATTRTPGAAPPGGGRGMGHGGGMGGHGHRGGRGGGNAGKHPADDSDPQADYRAPPWLSNDQVLIVQQDRQHVQIGLGDGERLDLRFDVPLQQSLNGSAMIRLLQTDGGMQIAMTLADGSRLEQDWRPSADGRHLTLIERWGVPRLQQPVSFVRNYVRLD